MKATKFTFATVILILIFNMAFALADEKEQKPFNRWSVVGGIGLTKVLNYNNGSVTCLQALPSRPSCRTGWCSTSMPRL